jgi:hypothetical protein
MRMLENEGQQPSRLQLDRFATGELKGSERATVQAWLAKNPQGAEHLEELKGARKQVKPLDLVALRKRANAIAVTSSAGAAPPAPVPEAKKVQRKVTVPDDRDAVLPEAAVEPIEVDHEQDDKSTHPFAEERGAYPTAQDAAAHVMDEEPAQAVYKRPTSSLGGPLPQDPPAANSPFRWLMMAVPGVMLAAAAALFVVPAITTPDDPLPADPGVRIKGDASLSVHTLDGGDLHPYQGQALAQGDVVGFQVNGQGRKGVVLLSVDGEGSVSVFWPTKGDEPEKLAGDAGSVPLPGSVTLDAAKGPEVFVAVFDRPVSWAKEQVSTAYAAGGASGVQEWARGEPDADAVAVEKR